MRFKVTRSSFDEQIFAVSTGSGMGTRCGVKAGELRTWLSRLGMGEAAISVVLNIPPNASVTVEMSDQDELRKTS